MSQAATAPRSGGRSLWPLWALLVIFALPAAAAWFFYLNPEYLPKSRVNRGELLEPPRPWPGELRLVAPDGVAFDAAAFRHRWTLVVPSRLPCAEACQRRLVELRQIRRALGEGSTVVERLAVFVGEGPVELDASLAGTDVVRASPEDDARLQALFGPGPDIWERIYVVDPFGNVMMRYAADAPPKDVLKDMERLFKASKTWIKGAQDGNR